MWKAIKDRYRCWKRGYHNMKTMRNGTIRVCTDCPKTEIIWENLR